MMAALVVSVDDSDRRLPSSVIVPVERIDATSAVESLLTAADAAGARAGISAVGKGELVVNVRDFGAVGNGSADDTAAIRAAVAAAGATPVLIPPGTYMIDAVGGGAGLSLSTNGASLVLAPAAVLKVIPNSATGYKLVHVTGNDCRIVGGTLLGDVQTHTGTTGEWGHLIAISGHRCEVSGVTVREAWGDGVAVMDGAEDAHLLNVIADSNRRQGASLIGAVRPRITGGIYRNTGSIAFTAPGSGIDVEPNPSSGYSVTDFSIQGVTCSGNLGYGILLVRATGQATTGTIADVVCSGNTQSGIRAQQAGSTAGTSFNVVADGLTLTDNTEVGLYVTTSGLTAKGITVTGNHSQGIVVAGVATLSNIVASGNYRAGIEVTTGGDGSIISGATVTGNGQQTDNTYAEVIIWVRCMLSDVKTYTGQAAPRANYGISVRSGSTDVELRGCRATGTPVTKLYNDAGVRTSAVPLPSRKVMQGTSAPTTGYLHLVGDLVENTTPTPGGTAGWVCTTAGGNGTAWAPTTAYALGAFMVSANVIYECTTAGTSGGSAPTAPGVGNTVTDGTVVWTERQVGIAVWKTYGVIGP